MGIIYKGWNAKIYIGEPWIEIGCAESVSVDITANLDAYYCIGKRTPEAVMEGNLEITGSISRAWVNIYYLNLIISETVLPTFHLCFKASEESNAPWIYLYDCKFEGGTIDIPQDGVLMEDYDFRAESIAVVTAP